MLENLDEKQFYASHGSMTDPGEFSFLINNLPGDIASVVEIIQKNLLHVFWAERYGVTLNEDQKSTLNIRRISEKLSLIHQANESPLHVKRDVGSRQVGNCRDFSLLMTAILREQGIPARARCGFARYFLPDHFEDHWICEYWSEAASRWIMVDSQLDALQMKVLGIHFDPIDVPVDQFITGGQAWKLCRSGVEDPNKFGIFDMHGYMFIWGDVIRDFLALNKIEILPWDGGWGFLSFQLTDPLPDEPDLSLFDKIAQLSANPYSNFTDIRTMYASEPRFHAPNDY